MNALISLYNRIFDDIAAMAPWLVPSLARFAFAAVLLVYFLRSGLGKLDGLFSPSFGAYYQIFPRAADAANGDLSKFGTYHWLVIEAGAFAEILLPILIVLGLLTRLAALGMIGFVIVQSLTDIIGHGSGAGAWFDQASDALILDQRLFWMLALVTLVTMGAGPLSLDKILSRKA